MKFQTSIGLYLWVYVTGDFIIYLNITLFGILSLFTDWENWACWSPGRFVGTCSRPLGHIFYTWVSVWLSRQYVNRPVAADLAFSNRELLCWYTEARSLWSYCNWQENARLWQIVACLPWHNLIKLIPISIQNIPLSFGNIYVYINQFRGKPNVRDIWWHVSNCTQYNTWMTLDSRA